MSASVLQHKPVLYGQTGVKARAVVGYGNDKLIFGFLCTDFHRPAVICFRYAVPLFTPFYMTVIPDSRFLIRLYKAARLVRLTSLFNPDLSVSTHQSHYHLVMCELIIFLMLCI